MAYSELIKNFQNIRDYMRQFYVYGFKQRSEYSAKSARSYDNERRRMESWLGDYMAFRQSNDGKIMFISMDSRTLRRNPLYNAFKAKSFTAGDITFHFYILDLLGHQTGCTVKEIMESIQTEYLCHFPKAEALDESTVRKKLKEYERIGLLKSEKRGRELVYSNAHSVIDLPAWKEAVAFFAEENSLGVIGSYLLERYRDPPDVFRFKHHYILHALDSEILYEIILAIDEKRCVELTAVTRRYKDKEKQHTVYPYKVYVSTQSGRQYLLCYHYRFRKPALYRLDNIKAIKVGAVEKQSDLYDGYCERFRAHLWGVSCKMEPSLDHIEMTVHVDDDEGYIVERLMREKRCGDVVQVDAHIYCFSADVYDATEMLPWLRTFIGRVVSLNCSDTSIVDAFWSDLGAMRRLYGGDENAIS